MTDVIIDSKAIINREICDVHVVVSNEQNAPHEFRWILRIFQDPNKPLFLRNIIGDSRAYSSSSVEGRILYANTLVQFRYEIPVIHSGDEFRPDISDLTGFSIDQLKYPDYSESDKMLLIADIIEAYFKNCDSAINWEIIYHSVKIDRESIEKALREFRGRGVLKDTNLSADKWLIALRDYRLQHESDAGEIAKDVNKEAKMQSSLKSKEVFIVYGHDHATKEKVARFIEHCGLNPIILHEQAKRGRTITEQLEAHDKVGYAIVLLTPDDRGRANRARGKLRKRARQNVILELGLFWGKLGRDCVHALVSKGVECPTDYENVLHTELDSKGAWKQDLFKDLKQIWPDLIFPA